MTKLKRLVHDRCGVPPDEQRLIFAGKQLDDDKTLGDYSSLGNRATVFLVLRLPGGSGCGGGYEKYFDHLRRFPAHAPKHPEECTICYEHPAIRMPCDHPLCPSCLMNYAWTEVGCNKKTEICCSLCKGEWPLHIIQDYSNVPAEEMELLQECLSKNFIANDPNISECPGCNNYCERKDKSSNRVYCRICSKLGKTHTYCWDCLKPWNNSDSNLQCGNGGCNSASFLHILQEAPLITPSYLKEKVQVPSKRACPACGSIIEHSGGCKHMICKDCHTEFCFLCLRIVEDNSSQCGSYNTTCAVAPVQDKLPRKP